MGKNGYRVIDADCHVTDREDDYRLYLEERFQRRPLFTRDAWDRSRGGRMGKDWVDIQTLLRDLDPEGIDTAILYPTTGLGIGLVREPELAGALCRAYHTWIAEACEAAPQRLKAVGLLAPQNVEASVREMGRAVTQLGLVGFMWPTYVPGRDPGSPEFHPIYREAERLRTTINFHATVRESTGVARCMPTFLGVHTVSHPFEQMIAVCSTIVGGIPELFPELKIAFLEAGIGWLPYWMERLDEEYEKRPEDAPHLKGKPSDYIRSGRLFFSCEPEEVLLPFVLSHVGEDVILYASDYPHWDSGWPHTAKTLRERADVSERQKRKIFEENPERFYRL